MKDDDQVSALATVMGWEYFDPHEQGTFPVWAGSAPHLGQRVRVKDWNPLTNIADCLQVVEMMRASDWRYMIGSNGKNEGYYCHFWTAERLGGIRAWSNDMLRAICEAVLKAHGKWVEE